MGEKILVDKEDLNTRAKILLVAKEEFLSNGFADASVRTIAKKAGLTTGAIYNLFKNKNGIFAELIGDVFEQFMYIIKHEEADSCNMAETNIEELMKVSLQRFIKMVEFFYDNWDEMKLLICYSAGSLYEHIFDKSIECVEQETIRWLEKDHITVDNRVRFFVHVMVTSHFENLKEIFYHDLKKADAINYAIDFNAYHCAGWQEYWREQIKKGQQ